MNILDYKKENDELRQRVAELERANNELIVHNMQLSNQMNVYFNVKQRVWVYKELLLRHSELIQQADMRNDEELLAIIETRLEAEHPYEDPNFGAKELASMIGTSQSRVLDLFRRSMLYKSLEDYLDYMRILRSMYYLMLNRDWNVAACAQEAGFSAIRSFNRKFQDALGMSPHEFRILIQKNPTQKKPLDKPIDD